MSYVIEMERVSKRFAYQLALDDVTFQVPAGGVFGLLGENGAGKTTSIRLMLGLERASSGDVRVLGRDSRRHGRLIRSKVGYVPEQASLYEWMTADEIGWFTSGFYPSGFEAEYRRQLAALRVKGDARIRTMSKGTRARVVLALALAHQPELLILDEPTSGLDTLVRHEFLDCIIDLASRGRTVLFSSHQISDVERVADVVGILRKGRLVACEPLDSLKCSTREVTVTLQSPCPDPPRLGASTLTAERQGNQWRLMVRHPDETAMARLEEQPGTVAVDTRLPSLEEIFVAYMKSEVALVPQALVTEEAPL